MIDTHCHLMDNKLSSKKDHYIEKAHSAGVTAMVTLGITIDSSKEAVAIAQTFNTVYAAVGIYPSEVSPNKETWEKDMTKIEELSHLPQVVAIGETGLDEQYIYDVPMETQIENLTAHLKLSLAVEKPLVIHSRGTSKQLLQTVQSHWDERLRNKVVFHCCEPLPELLSFAIEKDIYIGVNGDVTYNQEKALFVSTVPLERLVIETDAPYLLPQPLRDQKAFPNAPHNLPIIADKIATIKQTTIEEIDRYTTQNAQTLFGI